MTKQIGPWQQTYTNQIIDFSILDLASINIRDIAHALSMQCRFAGHIPSFYSVAEHSVWVSYRVPQRFALWGLMHDAAEAYITDIPTYVKDCIPAIRTLENNLLVAIALVFGLKPLTMPSEVKEVDLRILATEKVQFYSVDARDWELGVEPYSGMVLPCWSPQRAEVNFIERFLKLIHEN